MSEPELRQTTDCPFGMCNAHDAERGCIFVLDDTQWEAFCRLVDAPPTDRTTQRDIADIKKDYGL